MRSLLQRIASGDDTAVDGVVSTYGDLVWRIVVRRLGRNHPDLDDAVQNAFVDIWRHADRYDPDRGTEAAFIGVIAAHRAIDVLRQRASAAAPVDESRLSVLLTPRVQPDRIGTDPELARAFEGLRQEERDALRLRYHAGMRYDEIATALESKPATIRSRVFHGLRRLKSSIDDPARTGSAGVTSVEERRDG